MEDSTQLAIRNKTHIKGHNLETPRKSSILDIFNGLLGAWSITRNISSADKHYSGALYGNATFSARAPSSPGFDKEYMYHETGQFYASSGIEMNASRRYIYRYSSIDDKISVWFVKPDDQDAVDYLFHHLAYDLEKPSERDEKQSLDFEAKHLCEQDLYDSSYQFEVEHNALLNFSILHSVKGPCKDYRSMTSFERSTETVQ